MRIRKDIAVSNKNVYNHLNQGGGRHQRKEKSLPPVSFFCCRTEAPHDRCLFFLYSTCYSSDNNANKHEVEVEVEVERRLKL